MTEEQRVFQERVAERVRAAHAARDQSEATPRNNEQEQDSGAPSHHETEGMEVALRLSDKTDSLRPSKGMVRVKVTYARGFYGFCLAL